MPVRNSLCTKNNYKYQKGNGKGVCCILLGFSLEKNEKSIVSQIATISIFFKLSQISIYNIIEENF